MGLFRWWLGFKFLTNTTRISRPTLAWSKVHHWWITSSKLRLCGELGWNNAARMFSHESFAVNLHIGCTCLKLCGFSTFTGLTRNFHDPPPLLAENFHRMTSSMFAGRFTGKRNLFLESSNMLWCISEWDLLSMHSNGQTVITPTLIFWTVLAFPLLVTVV